MIVSIKKSSLKWDLHKLKTHQKKFKILQSVKEFFLFMVLVFKNLKPKRSFKIRVKKQLKNLMLNHRLKKPMIFYQMILTHPKNSEINIKMKKNLFKKVFLIVQGIWNFSIRECFVIYYLVKRLKERWLLMERLLFMLIQFQW